MDVNHGMYDYSEQVMIRIRPLNTTERDSQGYGRCLRQESAKTLVWLGHPETRFTFDHIACETISQVQISLSLSISGFSCLFSLNCASSGEIYCCSFRPDMALNSIYSGFRRTHLFSERKLV